MFDKPFGFYFLLFIILTLFFKFYAIIEGFVPAITTACVLAYLTHPVYAYMYGRTRNRSLSAFIVLFFTFILILVPVTFIGIAVQQQVQFVIKLDAIEFMRSFMQETDAILLERFNIQFFDKYLEDLVTPLLSAGQEGLRLFVPKMIMSVTQFILSTFITFFLMYYLLLNAKQVIKVIRYYGPLNDDNMDDLLAEMGKDTKTLILGQLLIAVIQGALTGLGFLLFGVPAVILWGLVAVITSFLPVLGAGLVWFPGCVYLFIQDNYFAAVGMLLWGGIIVSTSDNIIRPKLVNMLGEIHPVTVLLGVFIGIKEWGLIGIVLGPLMISVLITLIMMFREQFLDEA